MTPTCFGQYRPSSGSNMKYMVKLLDFYRRNVFQYVGGMPFVLCVMTSSRCDLLLANYTNWLWVFVKNILFDNMLNVSVQKGRYQTLHKSIYFSRIKSQDGHLLSTSYSLQYNVDVINCVVNNRKLTSLGKHLLFIPEAIWNALMHSVVKMQRCLLLK